MEVESGNLIVAAEVAAIIGLSNPKGVPVYAARYETFPVPVVKKGNCVLWLRQDVENWARDTGRMN